MLDSGTTTAEVARHIKFLKLKSLTVITNALNIAMELANLPHMRVIMIGGILRQMSYSLVGPTPSRPCGRSTPTGCFWAWTASTPRSACRPGRPGGAAERG